MPYIKWSQEQIDFLIANYPTRGANFCADTLQRKKLNVNQKAWKLGLKFIGLICSSPDNKICGKCKQEKPLFEFKLIKGRPHTYCNDCKSAISIEHRIKNKTKNSILARQRYLRNATQIKLRVANNTRNRLKVDPYFRMISNLRSRIRSAIKHCKKSNSTEKLTGCPLFSLRNHIASQFKTGMTWDNYGFGCEDC